jgi:hypothetical protein
LVAEEEAEEEVIEEDMVIEVVTMVVEEVTMEVEVVTMEEEFHIQ